MYWFSFLEEQEESFESLVRFSRIKTKRGNLIGKFNLELPWKVRSSESFDHQNCLNFRIFICA